MSYALVELPAGVALFKVGENPKLKAFHRFKSTIDALENTTQLVNGELAKPIKKFLKKNYVEKELTADLMVMDAKLGKAIKTALDIPCIHGDETMAYFRAIKANIDELLGDVSAEQLNQASLGLAHNLNRYKLKFSPDKIDMMVVQAVALLEDLDKEINKYAMRAKEWFGWHFPEMAKIVSDNGQYCKLVVAMQTRFNAKEADFSDIVEEDVAEKVREAAIVSMGTEISDDDIANIGKLCDEVVKSLQYREQLAAYLTSRMNAIAPNLTTMVGETIGARLIQKAGSLLSLAKYPSSTVQILGAEKALFRALKQRQATPKYGILYHAQLVAKAPAANKGTMSRVLAAKTSLSARIDSFGESEANDAGVEYRAAVEGRLKAFEEGLTYGNSGNARGAGRSFGGQNGGGAGPKRNRVEY
uniref:Nop domain-containing protein n=1 Tax=Neobodo designis TaxID=312471 RepID=A0A7S1LDX0_NEODS|mmetsp:Transcript_20239/g.62881  ORF Transcript_20239/g.62881 Transcript_20239/m.62881 type:complete len:416 (+) Transcript_20239:127-1374(+)|eukprot:CAMPEP_0174850488 /NCGR_PEP_ID=MMETSP1114-20130205/19552_1 /TAXON_ID=312471 /ORGANISM="Neobodo designis, Strain CCAP 1951/1" /LENGTH=415 /DNA_ID=CAMNT_0016084949 /DNA_START=126 /DNA_END=1373 /DNA_ORIENTATION=+